MEETAALEAGMKEKAEEFVKGGAAARVGWPAGVSRARRTG